MSSSSSRPPLRRQNRLGEIGNFTISQVGELTTITMDVPQVRINQLEVELFFDGQADTVITIKMHRFPPNLPGQVHVIEGAHPESLTKHVNLRGFYPVETAKALLRSGVLIIDLIRQYNNPFSPCDIPIYRSDA